MTQVASKITREYLSERLSDGSSLVDIVQTWLDTYVSGLGGSQVLSTVREFVIQEWEVRWEVNCLTLTSVPSSDIYVSDDIILQIEGGFVWLDFCFIRLICSGSLEHLWLVYHIGRGGQVDTLEEIGVAISVDVPKDEFFMQSEILYSTTLKGDYTLEFSSLASLKGTHCEHVQVSVDGYPMGYYVGL